jgi:hypothetical protein
MSIRPLPSISISCIETLDYDKAAKALRQTLRVCKDLSIKKVYWLSDSQCPSQQDLKAEWGKDFVQWVPIRAFDLGKSFNRQLEKLTLDLLPKTVDTDFNLIIQADGYAVNSDAWTDQFYDYDYIGASWVMEAEGRNVGNGGFSWRSKKLYEAILDLRAKYSLDELLQETVQDETWEDKFGGRSIPEDSLICKVYRPLLERQYGIRFALAELADQFSVETNGNTPWLGKSFGFHGRMTGSFYIHSDVA